MMQNKTPDEDMIRNLKDAGCCEKKIAAFCDAARQGKERECRKLLEQHRRTLMESIHEGQKCVDCLDYLMYQMDRDQKKQKCAAEKAEAGKKQKTAERQK